MEPNIELKKYIIIIINNAKGNIQRLNTILQKISSQTNFDILILTGEVFSLSTKKEDILSISFKGEIIIFDSSPIGEIIRAKYEYNNYNINKNIIFLNKSGIFSPENTSLNIAFLNGIESKELLEGKENNNKYNNSPYTSNFYKYKDVVNLIKEFEKISLSKKNKIDFFLINNFPKCFYEKYFNKMQQEFYNRNNYNIPEEQLNNKISFSLNYLLHIMNPRYVFTSVDDIFFKNVDDISLNSAGYRTFFYNLGFLEDKKNNNENFFVAVNYQSLIDLNTDDIIKMEKDQEEQGDVKFIKDNNLFKYFEFFEISKEKSLIQNYDDYLNICFNNNQIKSIKEICPIAKPLLISNLDYALSENEIKNYLISKYGSIKSIKFLTNRDTNKFNGRAILEFNNISSMNSILNNNGKDKLNDRIIKVVLYTPKNQLNNNNTHNNFHNNINIINNNISHNNNLRTADCWFCYDHNEKLDTKYIIKSFNNFYFAYSKGPIDKYHFLLIPKKHISSFIELNKDEKIEAEMIIQLIQDYLESKDCSYILFEKNLKYNFSNPLHMLINICGFQKALIEKISVFTENFLIEEKMNDFIVSFNEKFLDCYNEKDEYIYINIPKIYKQKIIRKIIFIKTKEYKIDYPRKLICNLINKEERLNWKNTVELGEEYLKEIKNELKNFLDKAYE